jgi:hypothetical protein
MTLKPVDLQANLKANILLCLLLFRGAPSNQRNHHGEQYAEPYVADRMRKELLQQKMKGWNIGTANYAHFGRQWLCNKGVKKCDQ